MCQLATLAVTVLISMYLKRHRVTASTSDGSQTHLEPIRLDIGDYLIG
jgi:hypothetical protein